MATQQQRPRDGRPGLGITQSVVLGRRNANSILVASKVGKDGRPSEKWEWLRTFTDNLTYGSADPDVPDISDLEDSEKEAIAAVVGLAEAAESEGIQVTEGRRLRVKLSAVADGFAALKNLGTITEDDEGGDDDKASPPPPDADRLVGLLLEIRDIIGDRSDFANAFLAVGGLSVLLGAPSERIAVPRPVRSACLLVLSDLVTKIPPVQYTLLDHGGIRALAAMYFAEFPAKEENRDPEEIDETDGLVRARVVDTMAAAVVGHGAAERMFVTSPLARQVIESGIGMHQADETLPAPPVKLRRRSVAFLEDLLVTSKGAPQDMSSRVAQFGPCLDYAAGTLLVAKTESDWKTRKLALEIFSHILRQQTKDKGSDDDDGGGMLSMEVKEQLASAGEARRAEIGELDIKAMEPQEKEEADAELFLWGQISDELVQK